MEWRCKESLGHGGLSLNPSDTWCGVLLDVPNPECPGIFLTWKSGTQPTFSAAPGPTNYGVQWVTNPNFNFSTVVGSVQASSGVFVGLQTPWSNAVSRYRMIARSTTVELDVAELYNQGSVAAAQISLGEGHVLPEAFQSGVPFVEDIEDLVRLDMIPTDPTFALQLSPKSYTGLAKDGVYMPMAFDAGDTDYIDAVKESAIAIVTSFQGDTAGTVGLIPSNSKGVNPASNKPPSFYLPMSAGISIWTNLLPQAQLAIKEILLVEARPTLFGPWAPFSTPGCPPDPVAIEEAFLARYHMADAYPASANLFGSIWKGIKTLAPKLGELYQKNKALVQSGVSMLPGGAAINKALDTAERLVEHLKMEEGEVPMEEAPKTLKKEVKKEVRQLVAAAPKPKRKVKVSAKRRGT